MQNFELDGDADVARANLLRMRGEYAEARTLLEQVLAKTPRSTVAHELMGDIVAQQAQIATDPTQDLRNALHWYELALQLDPTSTSLSDKAAAMTKRIEDTNAVQTLKLLGIPTASKRLGGFMAATAAFVVLIAIAGWLIGRSAQQPPAATPYNQPIEVKLPASQPATMAPDKPAEPAKPATETAKPRPISPTPTVTAEVDFVTKLKAAMGDGTEIVSASLDPRAGGHWTITAVAGDDATAWEAKAATIGKAALGVGTDFASITVRMVHQGAVVFLTDFERASESATPADPVPTNSWSANEKAATK